MNGIVGFSFTPSFIDYMPPAYPRPHSKGSPIPA
jgi:hypothetical protein